MSSIATAPGGALLIRRGAGAWRTGAVCLVLALASHAVTLWALRAADAFSGAETITAPAMQVRTIDSARTQSKPTTLPPPSSLPVLAEPLPAPPIVSPVVREPVAAMKPAVTNRADIDSSRNAAAPGAAPLRASPPPQQPSDLAAEPVRLPVPAAAIALTALAPAPDYLAGGQLDPGPRPLDDIQPAYPEEAGLQEGSVVLRLLISDSGRVDDVSVVRAAPPGLFEKAALDAFGAARFSPGKVLGLPVKSQITIEVRFTPINRGGKVSGRSY